MINKLWLAGKPKDKESVYDGPALWEVACEYFEWCTETPVTEMRHSRSEIQTLELPRIFSVDGFLLFASLSTRAWEDHCKAGSPSEFYATNINHTIRCQKFENAAVKTMDPTLIAKDLGLANRSVTTTTANTLFDFMDDAPKLHEQPDPEA